MIRSSESIIQTELDRHPALAEVRGVPAGNYTTLVGDVSTASVDHDTNDATLTVRWFAGEAPDARPQFSFHYSDEFGDFGWHHEPNPHVDGWGHFQTRGGPTADYEYRSYSFGSLEPARVVWTVLDALWTTLDTEWPD